VGDGGDVDTRDHNQIHLIPKVGQVIQESREVGDWVEEGDKTLGLG
jgi:hypothetical protein